MTESLSPPQNHEDYLKQLRSLYRLPRLVALGATVLGAILVVAASQSMLAPLYKTIGYGLIGFGWMIFIYVIIKRTRWAALNRIKEEA